MKRFITLVVPAVLVSRTTVQNSAGLNVRDRTWATSAVTNTLRRMTELSA